MKFRLLLAAILFITTFPVFCQSDFYEQNWSKVYQCEIKDLPKSALEATDTIYRRARREKNIEQFTKVLLYQSKFALILSKDAEVQIVNRLIKESAISTAPQKNIIESIIAKIYWQYFQENRWRYYQRTRTTEKVNPDDFRTWDTRTMFEEIHHHFQLSLQDEDVLQKTRLTAINELINEATNSQLYRPTVFDLLANIAIDFYQTDENSLSIPKNGFVLNDTLYFNAFEDMTLAHADSLSLQLNALKLYQRLLRFHKDKDTTAYVDAELQRLNFLVKAGNFDNENHFYKTALRRLSTKFKHHPASTLSDFEFASVLYREGSAYSPGGDREIQFRLTEALDYCEKAIQAFPKSDGAEKCAILKSKILDYRINLQAEKFIPIDKPSFMKVAYANISALSFRIYPMSPDDYDKFLRSNDSTMMAQLKAMPVVSQWKVELKNIGDYQQHNTEVSVPALSPGTYLIIADVDASHPASKKKVFAHAFINVTNLVMIESRFRKNDRLQIVDRNTGKPISGATVTLTADSTRHHPALSEHLTTDKEGFVEMKGRLQYINDITTTITHQNDHLQIKNYYLQQHYDRSTDDEGYTVRTFLFTDRSIYRPGQTVYFKGILLKIMDGKSSVVAGEWVEVELHDVNYKKVGSQRLKSNAFGSFIGEFKLPATGLMGEYTIVTDEDSEADSKFYKNADDFNGADVEISVEEYKRPSFETAFKPVTQTFRPNDKVSVTGSAAAFNGSKISRAKVSYRVVRRSNFPYWDWRMPRTYSPEMEIAHGDTVTNDAGEFVIHFEAIPDESVQRDQKPVFQYEVTADVTDINGETRSATTTVKVAYHTLQISMNGLTTAARKATTFTVTSENLNNQHIPASGTITIYKLQGAPTPVRKRPWGAPDVPLMSEESFRNLFPNDAYGNEDDKRNWKKGRALFQAPFNTAKSKDVVFTPNASWPTGEYIAKLATIDPTGDSVIVEQRFSLLAAGKNDIGDNQLLAVETDKMGYQVGDLLRLRLASASTDLTVMVDIERNQEISKTYVVHLDGRMKEISIPIGENMRDGFVIHCTAVHFNAFISEKKDIAVLRPENKLEIETVIFKDKLLPGAKQTWTFEIKGKDAEKREAEILASMYDASLDQFKSHEWYFNPTPHWAYYSHLYVTANRTFGNAYFRIENDTHSYNYFPAQHYDELDWFGFSITNNYQVLSTYNSRLYYEHNPKLSSHVKMVRNRKHVDGIVFGKVTDHHGEPLPGTSVLIKGTTIGTVTDSDGRYEINAHKGDTIVFSFIGYNSANAIVGKKNGIDVVMEEEIAALGEVVVVASGYAVQKKMMTGSVSVLEYVEEGDVFFTEALAGQAPGIQIKNAPGGPKKIMIRGNSSTNNNAEPLYVVDGVIVTSSKLEEEDIDRIEVLKDASATAIYGARAANGVVIVTTKSGQKKIDDEMAKVSARKNFNETAFFFPQLRTSDEGRVQFTFTTPESVTRWKLQILAHTKDLAIGHKIMQAVTQKDLMVTPNAPRFLRIGDQIVFSAKITNLTTQPHEGNVALQLTNAVTGQPIDALLANNVRNKTFRVGEKGNTEVSWTLKIPSGIDAVQYKVVAKSGKFSDGEQNAIPVLSNRMLVTESLQMHVRGGQTKTYNLEKLASSGSRFSTLTHHQVTIEVTSNPVWYAIQSMPYLMEFPHECAEQLFSRYYSNALASHLMNSHPKLKAVFDQWKSSGELVSALEKNQELKSILIEETPWVRDAANETEQKKRIALLFDLNQMTDQMSGVISKLKNMQFSNGGFPWFSGGTQASRYITQHVVSGIGHLEHLKVKTTDDRELIAIRNNAIQFLDNAIVSDYERILKDAGEIRSKANTTQSGEDAARAYLNERRVYKDQIQYLYMKTFFPDTTTSGKRKEATDYFVTQSGKFWKEQKLYVKAMIALIQYRHGNTKLASDILLSIKENAIISEDLGMYWKENKAGWYWDEAPIETQALLIEAFTEIQSHDKNLSGEERTKCIDEMRIWLLRNKQTTQWKTTKATTEAIYALMLQGTDWISIDNAVEVKAGSEKVVPKSVEAGTGYFKKTWSASEVKPSMSSVTLTHKGQGIAWGGMYWQYFEDLDKITGAETPLRLTKKVFVVQKSDAGEVLREINKGLVVKVGDLIRIRIELTASQAMEFLHMKDMRASGLEPVDVISGYKWQDGLGYYQSTKDASTNFFFDHVREGVYVFEYDLRANNKGDFANGITTIQSMYAPEFGSHSEGVRVVIE